MSDKYYIIKVKYLNSGNIYYISGITLLSFNAYSNFFDIDNEIEKALIFDNYDIHKLLRIVKIDFENDNVKITKQEVVL